MEWNTEGLRVALIAQAWQLAVAALVVAFAVRLLARNRPHLAHALWLVVLLKCVTPPLVGSPVGLFCWAQQGLASAWIAPASSAIAVNAAQDIPLSVTMPREVGAFDAASLEPVVAGAVDEENFAHSPTSVVTTSRSWRWSHTLLTVWIAGAALALSWTLARVARCGLQMRRAGWVEHPALAASVASLRKRIGVRRRVRVLVTGARVGPAVVGIFRPTIVLPAVLVEAQSTRALEPILAHELAHVRRGDLWVSLLQFGVSVLWWFHPLVWRASRLITCEAERCCDEEVMAALRYSPREYARSLLAVLELKRDLAAVPAVPGIRPVEITSQRLERIMRLGHGGYRRTPWWCWLAMLVVVAVLLPGAARVAGTEGEEPNAKSTVEAPPEEKPTAEPDAKRRRLHEDGVKYDERADAARQYYELLNKRYHVGEVPLDMLLDAMRRQVDTEVIASYARLEANAKLSQAEMRRQLALIRLDNLARARDRSLALWRELLARYRTDEEGVDAESERQAREQYFYFRQQVERALEDTKEASNNEPMVVQLYEVADLIAPRPNFLRSDAQQLQNAKPVELTEAMFEDLIQCIRSTVAPHSWTSDDGDGTASIEPFVKNGSLIVCQTDDAHQQIEQLINQLRTFQEAMVTYRVRPLSESRQELQQRGIEVATPLTAAQLESLGDGALDTDAAETLGRMTVFNGQTGVLKFNDSQGASGNVVLQHVLAPRYDFMQLWIAGDATGLGGQIVRAQIDGPGGLVIAARMEDGREVMALVTWVPIKSGGGISVRVGFER